MPSKLSSFGGICEDIIAEDYPYRFTKTLPKKRQDISDTIEATDNIYIHTKTNGNHAQTQTQTQTNANTKI